ISSDKDLMQLVGPTVSMYDPMKDRQIGVPEVVEKWGVPPEKMIDLQAMMGDSVDNVPGVPGIGQKTAAQLLEQFGDLDTLLARAGEIKQDKRRQTIIDNADKARISRELVRLKDDVPMADGLHDLVLQSPDGPKLIAFLKTMEFSTLTRRVAEATGTDAAEIAPAHVVVDLVDVHGPDVGAGAKPAGTSAPESAAAPASAPVANGKLNTPAALAAARAQAAASARIDHKRYACIHHRAELGPGSPRRARPASSPSAPRL